MSSEKINVQILDWVINNLEEQLVKLKKLREEEFNLEDIEVDEDN